MTKYSSFEDVLADVQSELIAVSLEYAGSNVSAIFAYGAIENKTVQFDPFFVLNGTVVERHQIPEVDTSRERPQSCVGSDATNIATARISEGTTF